MAREFPAVPFERYADDAVVHCVSEAQATLGAGGDRGQDGAGRAAAASRQDPDRVLQGREAAWLVRAHLVHVPGVHVPAAQGAEQGREAVQRVPARDQQGRPEEDQCGECGPGGCTTAPAYTFAELARRINPIVRGWMQYYGAFYRSATVSSPDAHQRLPGALDPQEVQTAAGQEEGHRVLAGDHPTVSPHVRALGMDYLRSRVPGDQDDKSPVNREVHAGICGSVRRESRTR